MITDPIGLIRDLHLSGWGRDQFGEPAGSARAARDTGAHGGSGRGRLIGQRHDCRVGAAVHPPGMTVAIRTERQFGATCRSAVRDWPMIGMGKGRGVNRIAQWTLPQELVAGDSSEAVDLLSTYFHTMLEDGAPYYSGARFEIFAGGGDACGVSKVFTAEDLVAVTLLSVRVKGPAALRILDIRADELNGLLAQIPTDCELRDAPDSVIGPRSPAEDLWTALRDAGVGPVTTSKLLARKRPMLLPVIDSVVKKVLKHPAKASFWQTLRAELNAEHGRLYEHLVKIRDEAGLGEGISVIRCFDVVVWMIGKGESARKGGPGHRPR